MIKEKASYIAKSRGIDIATTLTRDWIGIWKLTYLDGTPCYQRDPDVRNDWCNWADVHTIPIKSEKKRIVLLGESVARGYLFDPFFNPAKSLEHVLNSLGSFEYEVVDLAKVSIQLDELTEISRACIALNPDVIIVFAGNNFFSSLRSDSLYHENWEQLIRKNILTDENGNKYLDKAGFKDIKWNVEKKLVEITTKYLDSLSGISVESGVPVVFVIPEFNLLDWKSTETENILFRLSDSNCLAWISLRNEICDALSKGEFDQLEWKAKALINLDLSHPFGYEVLAEYYIKNGLISEAEQLLKNARDTSIFNRSTGQARIFSVIGDTLGKEAPSRNIATIDLPEIFKKKLNGGVPDRHLFIDYCHLSDTGINIMVAYTTQKIVEMMSGLKLSIEEIEAHSAVIDKEKKANGYLCAAVHNAHYGQKPEIINYLCLKAINTSINVVEVMKNYIDMATRKTSTVLCKSHEKIVESELIAQYVSGHGFINKKNNKILDFYLVNAMVSALESKNINLRDSIDALRISEHGITEKKINLLQSFYRSKSYDEFIGSLTLYYQAHFIESEFIFVAEGGLHAEFELTYRTKSRVSSNEKILINVNGLNVVQLSLSEKWVTNIFSTKNIVLKRGLNHLTINWTYGPRKPVLSEALLETVPTSSLNEIVEIFGEIHSFRVKAIKA